MNKKFRFEINGIQREFGTFDTKTIKNKLKQKWVETAINNCDNICIEVFNPSYVDRFTSRSGWNVTYNYKKSKFPIIKLTDSVGKEEVFDFIDILEEEFETLKNKFFEDITDILEQSKLLFLTDNKDFECAWVDLNNKLNYFEKTKLKKKIKDYSF